MAANRSTASLDGDITLRSEPWGETKKATQVVKASEDGLVPKDVPDDIKRVIQTRLEVAGDRITLDASLMNDLGADSLALLDLTLALEEAFDIDISDDAADKIRTVRDAVEFIEKHAQARRSA
jgi:acyl carrier protein